MNKSTDEQAAAAKRDRIEHHRLRVRNGPVNFRDLTTGQVRRAKERALRGQTRRVRRAQIRQHFADRRATSQLRAHLQGAGVLAYHNQHFRLPPQSQAASVLWIVARFAPVEADGSGDVTLTRSVVMGALQEALQTYQRLEGRPVTDLSSAYVLPVTLADEVPA